MKFLSGILFSIFAFNHVWAADAEFDLYMRAPVGSNGSGGKQVKLTNPGSKGNEFRLGNETAYAEATGIFHAIPKAQKGSPFFDGYLTFAYGPPMNSQYGDTGSSGDSVQVIQAYVKGGNLDEIPISFWAGKRFYRDANIYMNDIYYFANMSGNGGGVEDIKFGSGSLSVAWLQYADSSLQNTSNGIPAKQALDFRYKDFELGTNDHLNFWFAYGYAAPGTGQSTPPAAAAPVDYGAASGQALGVLWNHALTEKSKNEFTVMYGTGVMESFDLNTAAINTTGGDVTSKQNRLRVVDNVVFELSDKWSLEAAILGDLAQSEKSKDNKSHWYSMGIRPVYYFTEHYHLVFGAGHSIVGDDSEKDGNGNSAGERTLTRFTVAPEVAIGKGFFKRPVIRAYGTYSMWNAANQDRANSKSLGSDVSTNQKTASINGKRDALQFGLEGEIWF